LHDSGNQTLRTRTTFDEEGNPASVVREVVPNPTQPADENEAAADHEEEVQAEDDELADEDAETDNTTADSMGYRNVPSHFYPEAKAKSAAWCGTHKRFEEGEETQEPAPVSEEMKEAINELGEVSYDFLHLLLRLPITPYMCCRIPIALIRRPNSLSPHLRHTRTPASILATKSNSVQNS
jgi:hypothetical protein